MPVVKPFKGVLYNIRKIKKISAVVAPPYDIIPKDMQDKLYRSSPYNVVRLILGKINSDDDPGDNRYTRARDYFQKWLEKKILVRDEREAIYIYSQKYKNGNKVKAEAGFIALMALDDGESNKVKPHENTLAAPKADRLCLMREVRANLSPIFVLYEDAKHKILKILKDTSAKKKALIDVNIDSVRHRLWRLDDRRAIKDIELAMRKKASFIADGHHRYETARNYLVEIKDKDLPGSLKRAAGYLMVYFVESDERMLTILPAHRVIRDIGSLNKADVTGKLARFFEIKKVPNLGALMAKLAAKSRAHIFGLYTGKNNFYILNLKDPAQSDSVMKSKSRDWKRLDVSILHLFIFQHVLGIRDEDDNIEFLKDPQDAVKSVNRGEGQAAFFLNPTKVSQVKRVASLGECMPRKATYFYPKQLSGLVINKF